MEIDLFTPDITEGKTLRQVTLRENVEGNLWQQVQANVWITPDDSGKVMAGRSREAALALLERAIVALRQP